MSNVMKVNRRTLLENGWIINMQDVEKYGCHHKSDRRGEIIACEVTSHLSNIKPLK